MSIKQQGGVFGRNPTFNDVEVEGNLTVDGEQIPAASNIAKLDTANTFTQRQTVSGTYSIDSVWTGASSAGVGGAFRAVQDDGAAMASGDRIGYLIWGGAYDGANNIGYNAAISGYASENWTAGARGTDVIIQTTDNGTTARNNRLVVRNTGNVEISRNLVISTSGYGIDFSATAGTGTSELLDDYEEGAWTPLISQDGDGAVPFTSVTQSGAYTKVGNLVTVTCLYEYSGIGSVGNNFAYMGGLPFTAANNSIYGYGFSFFEQSAYDTKSYSVAALSNAAKAFFQYDNGGGTLYVGTPRMVGNTFPSAAKVRFTLTYIAV